MSCHDKNFVPCPMRFICPAERSYRENKSCRENRRVKSFAGANITHSFAMFLITSNFHIFPQLLLNDIHFAWNFVFMPPTSKKLRGHIGLGLSVRDTFWQLRNSRTPYARILKFYMWHVHEKYVDPYFFSSADHVVLELCPFFDYVWTTLLAEYLKNR